MEETSTEMQAQEQHSLVTEVVKREMKILVPVDESEGSLYALKWAIDHLVSVATEHPPETVDPDTITLLHVQPVFQPFIYPAGPVVYATPAVIESVRKGQEQNTAAILSRALQVCKQHKIKAETLILEGDAKDKICQAAEQLHVDLLVIGSRGLGPIKRAFLGSVSNYCAHHVNCPVLIVKPPAKQAHE